MSWYSIVENDISNQVIDIPDDSNGLLVTSPAKLSNLHIRGGTTQLVLRAPCILENITLEGFGGDGIIISSSNCVLSNVYGLLPRDLIPYDKLHPDFIQFVAIDNNGKPDTSGVIENTIIERATLYAPFIPENKNRGVQGIAGFDCLVKNLEIISPEILTDVEQHGISFNTVENCIVSNGKIDSVNTNMKPGIIFSDRKGFGKSSNNRIENTTLQILDVEDNTVLNNVNIEKVNTEKHKTEVDPMFNTTTETLKSNKLDHMQIAYMEAAKDTSELPGAAMNDEVAKYWEAVNYKANDDAVPWCSAFTNYILMKAGIPRTESAAAMSFKKWGTEIAPRIGCVVVIPRGGWKGHVGFLAGEDTNYYYVLGGNQNNQVNIAKFSKSKNQFYFRWHKQLRNSKTMWIELFKISTGIGGAGGAGTMVLNKDSNVKVEPDTGHSDKVDISETQASTVVQSNDFKVPDNYLLIPDVVLYGVLFIGVLYAALGLYVIKERNDKIKNLGI